MGNMRFKVGDRVRIKSLDWYNENKNEDGNIDISHNFTFYADRSKYCGKVFTIDVVFDNCYTVKEDNHEYYWSDEMIEGLAEELLDNDMEEHQKIVDEIMTIQGIEPIEAEIEEVWHCPDGYIFKDENGNVINATKIVLEKKKEEYPKTYEELVSLVKRMREAQIMYWDSINISKPNRPLPTSIVYLVEAQDLEREVDEYLKKMEK